ncbi:glycosylphosphatidylinositol-anchored high density lipoprotein-binding protein 1 isoform X2 [Pteronotus mesoamericanus]|nr:glycosylphosphatidylinositol-anchored high density lipoprotein-binding protein 1 isoform X2 [Pteronotus parnellii mesoamericanus]
MKALAAALLVLLLSRQPGQAQNKDMEEDEEDEEQGDEDEDEDEDEEDKEAGSVAGGRGKGLQCYTCLTLSQEGHCNQTRSCNPTEPFCKIITYEWDFGSGIPATYSLWCADSCTPVTKTADGTLITTTCCQTNLCNIPPWQGQPGRGAGGPQGSPGTVAATFLLSLLPGLRAMGP